MQMGEFSTDLEALGHEKNRGSRILQLQIIGQFDLICLESRDGEIRECFRGKSRVFEFG
jgi:hypothetical protein